MAKSYNPTPSQKLAIELKNKTILVAAGAGSGKTSVLTRRVIKRIVEGESIDRFLIVTFTNASAADVREKLAEILEDLIATYPGNAHFVRQRYLLADANICTISSYCLSLVKENFQLLGLSPKVNMIDDTEENMYMRRVLDELITSLYGTGEEWFLALCDNFSDFRNDESLIEEMIALYRALRVTENWREMLSLCAESLKSDASIIKSDGYFATKRGKTVQTKLLAEVKRICREAGDLTVYTAANTDSDKFVAPVAEFQDICENIFSALKSDYDSFSKTARKLLEEIPATVPYKADRDVGAYITAEKKRLVKKIRGIRDTYCISTNLSASDDAEKTAFLVDGIQRFLDLFDIAYREAKRENGLLDFADFESMALALLTNPDGSKSDICISKMQGITEIFIDEYQDVNPLQDKIFSLLSNGKNRFMVGDIKQSIYRFRNAYPDIFMGYKERFPDAKEDDSPTGKIFLKENFRCSDSIIRFVNLVFQRLTAGTPYFAEYDNEWLVHASQAPEIPRPVVVAVSPTDGKRGSNTEAKQNEADFVAREIKRLVETEVSDNGKRYRYSDFAVMFSAIKKYSIEFEKAFNLHGIPYKKEKSEDFLSNPSIMLALAAMRAVDNPTDDISFCAALRSPIFDFSSDELYRIRRFSQSESMYLASKRYLMPSVPLRCTAKYRCSGHRYGNTLRAKCRSMLNRLKEWRGLSCGTPCDEFLRSFFITSGLMHTCINSGTRNSLLLMYELAVKYEKSSFHGLSGFLEYIDELKKGGKEISDAAVVDSEDAVSMLTVHKSKGLEYKVCFVVSTDRVFGKKFGDTKIILKRGEGVFFPLVDMDKRIKTKTLFQLYAEQAEYEATVGEELRKLYVALTRAKERLYITGLGAVDCFEKEYTFDTSDCWMKLILSACFDDNIVFDKRYIPKKPEESVGYIKSEKTAPLYIKKEHIDAAMYQYPNISDTLIPKKISVSELRVGLLEDDEYDRSVKLSIPVSRVSAVPAFARGDMVSYGDIGTANHLFMQFCDFGTVERYGVEHEANRLLNVSIIDKIQREMLNIDSLSRFFESDLYEQICTSDHVCREKRFSILDKTVFESNTEPVLVQGVIDCFFKNRDGTYTVVDYKTDRVKNPEELITRHKIQLLCYCRAVSEMTGCLVSRAVLYSFHFGREVEVEVE